MIPSSLSSTELLTLLTDVCHSMQHNDRPFIVRVREMFVVLHRGMRYHDGRLTYWLQSLRPGSQRQEVYSADIVLAPWNNQRTRQVALNRTITRNTLSPHNDGVYVGVPVQWHNCLWGVLELRATHADDIDALVQEFLAACVPHLALAIIREGERLTANSVPNMHILPTVSYHTTHHVMSNNAMPESTTLAACSSPLLAAMEEELEDLFTLNTLLTRLLRWALDQTGGEAGAICLVDETCAELTVQVYEGYTTDVIGRGLSTLHHKQIGWEQGLAGKAARSGRALLVRDITLEDDVHPIESHVRAELAVPIQLHNTVLAVVVLDSPRSSAFGDRELAFVNALCERAAHPLQRAMHYQHTLETSTQLGHVFSNIPTGLALLDIAGRVLRANPAWATTWHLPEQTQQPENPFYVSFDLVDALLPRLDDPNTLIAFCTQGQQKPAETHLLTLWLKQPIQEVQIWSVPTRDTREHITGRLWMVQDITRESELDRAKNEFVSTVTHELRTPLTSILGYTELLLARDFSPSQQRQFIEIAHTQADRLANLVDDLLNMLRLESGRASLNCWIVAIRQVVSEITRHIGALDKHNIVIRLNEKLPAVFVDRDKVKQILVNLITNAIKYSPHGGEIEVIVHAVHVGEQGQRVLVAQPEQPEPLDEQVVLLMPDDHPPGTWVVVSVRDTGIGIAPNQVPHIWDKFYRVDTSNTSHIGGTGLGLSIAHSLVTLHGGRIWVDSQVNVGSTFSFTLPVADKMPPNHNTEEIE